MKIVILFTMILCSWGFSYAADFDSLIEQAKQEYASGESLKAVASLKAAVFSIWDTVPLTVINSRLIMGKDDYLPRQNNIYKAGEPIFITSEIMGYQIKHINQDNTIDIATDLYVIDDSGNVLSGKQNFGRFNVVSPIPKTEFFLNLAYTLTGASAGNYNLKTVVRDLNSGKSTDFSNKVQIQ